MLECRMLPPLTLGRWFPYTEAIEYMPEEPGVFQIRREQGLVDFPRGKSAMLRYGASERSLRRVFAELLGEPGPEAVPQTIDGEARVESWLVRWATSPVPHEHCARLLASFTERFGAPPRDQP